MKSPALFTYLWRAKYVSIPVNLGKQIQKLITQKIAVKKKKGCNCINELCIYIPVTPVGSVKNTASLVNKTSKIETILKVSTKQKNTFV